MTAVLEAQSYPRRIEESKLETIGFSIPDGAYVDWACKYEFIYIGYSASPGGWIDSVPRTNTISTTRPLSNANIEKIWWDFGLNFDWVERISLTIEYPCCRLYWADWLPF